MTIYQKDGKDYILLSNTNRGVMKIPTEGIPSAEPITNPVKGGGPSGLKYETISSLKGVEQLARLDKEQALLLVRGANGNLNLQSIALP